MCLKLELRFFFGAFVKKNKQAWHDVSCIFDYPSMAFNIEGNRK